MPDSEFLLLCSVFLDAALREDQRVEIDIQARSYARWTLGFSIDPYGLGNLGAW